MHPDVRDDEPQPPAEQVARPLELIGGFYRLAISIVVTVGGGLHEATHDAGRRAATTAAWG
jgi:hypothetical protein